jgi:hypothetical protein
LFKFPFIRRELKEEIMGVYLSRWEKLKKDFETNSNLKRPQETVKKALIGTVAKSSGLTPIMKDIDSALEKKQRTPLEKALNQLMATRSTYCTFLMEEQKHYLNDPNDPDLTIWTAYRNLIFGIQKLEEDGAAAAKTLQEAKGGGESITWFGLEGDVKGTVEKAKKDFGPFAAQEKKNLVLKKADPALKAAKAYTEAAAKTNFLAAKGALLNFKVEAKKCADAVGIVAGKETDANYKKVLVAFQNAMQALSVSARVDTQIQNLQQAMAAHG